jgi:hypothetical protein
MLIFTPFALCFVTLCSIFMHFPELTYLRDAIVAVPYFLLFLCFRKVTQEIFSELDETSSETEREPEGGQRLASPPGGTAQPLAVPTCGEGTLVHL